MDRLYEGCKVRIDPAYATVFQLPVDTEGIVVTRSPIVSDRWVVQFGTLPRPLHLQDNRLIALSPARREQTVTIDELVAAVPYASRALSIPDPE